MTISPKAEFFIKQHGGVQPDKTNPFIRRITYDGKVCGVTIVLGQDGTQLEIKPVIPEEDIGSPAGAGGAIYKTFKNT